MHGSLLLLESVGFTPGCICHTILIASAPSLCTSCHFNRLHPTCKPRCTVKYSILSDILKRVVGLRDQQNKIAHAQSTKLACEVAGAICTVSSLTREDNCLRYYSNSLDEALKRSNKMALWSNLIFFIFSVLVLLVSGSRFLVWIHTGFQPGNNYYSLLYHVLGSCA